MPCCSAASSVSVCGPHKWQVAKCKLWQVAKLQRCLPGGCPPRSGRTGAWLSCGITRNLLLHSCHRPSYSPVSATQGANVTCCGYVTSAAGEKLPDVCVRFRQGECPRTCEQLRWLFCVDCRERVCACQ